MFHLVKGLYDNYNKREEYSILLLGLENSGKTTFLEKLKELYVDKNQTYKKPKRILPTVGQNVGHVKYDAKVSLKIWDLAGQAELRGMWERYFEVAHGIIFLVDSGDRSKLEECKEELMKILNPDEFINDEEKQIDKSIPILMLANKQDLENHLEVEDIKEIFNKVAEHLNARDSRVLPVSGLKGDGVKEALEWMVVRLERNKSNRPPNYK